MLDFLLDAIEKASADADTRVIILAADGPVFSSGHDLKELVMYHLNMHFCISHVIIV